MQTIRDDTTQQEAFHTESADRLEREETEATVMLAWTGREKRETTSMQNELRHSLHNTFVL